MRTISVQQITESVESLFLKACIDAGEDLEAALSRSVKNERNETGRAILKQLQENICIAREYAMPICQDTGMAVVFMDIGQDVRIEGGGVEEAVNEGVRRAYKKGCFRSSVTSPLERVNTGDNTPAVIHYSIIKGDELIIQAAPKGFGSENMSCIKMLKPSDGVRGVKDFIVQAVKSAGGNPCPPVVVGVGIGGTMEKAALLAKRQLLRPLGQPGEDSLCKMEEELLDEINRLNIGPMGLGGNVTALAVHIAQYPTHIAGLPVAVNMQCHAYRHGRIIL